jgi:hypothetical protein
MVVPDIEDVVDEPSTDARPRTSGKGDESVLVIIPLDEPFGSEFRRVIPIFFCRYAD